MSAMVPLPQTVREKVVFNKHPGLALDKYANSCLTDNQDKLQEMVQKPTIKKVVELSQVQPQGLAFENLCQRRETILSALGADRFLCTSTGPLALHLARASALENAGICLHHIYGFAYLPGSGLKGMARAYAREVWLPSVESDKSHAEKKILSVFGNEPQKKPFECGEVVFHDGWPQKWPQLILDIVNNHHSAYYNGGEKDGPGDWEDPIPVYFMAVVPGIPFSFAISPRRKDMDAELVQLAREWLIGALCYMGAGAKTNAGYGSFAPVNEPKPILPERTRAVFETEVELVTPAFLAGASQNESDCDFRGATLRGLLRWWWRTLHAAHLEINDLRKLESIVWGNTESAGAIRIKIEPKDKINIQLSPIKKLTKNKKGKDILVLDRAFADKNDILISKAIGTPPIIYITYGIDEFVSLGKGIKKRKPRWCALPGAKWDISLIALKNKQTIPIDLLLDQGKAALWLLCNYGGCGSKARKGFGSLKMVSDNDLSLDWCKKISRQFRESFGFKKEQISYAESPSIEFMKGEVVKTNWKNYWYTLNSIGDAMARYAQAPTSSGHGKHCEAKKALGLPRQIHGPSDSPLPHQKGKWEAPKKLVCPKGERHASPVHFHLKKEENESLTIQITAFPSPMLPDYKSSKSFLENYLSFIKRELMLNAQKNKNMGQKVAAKFSQSGFVSGIQSQHSRTVSLPKVGDLVDVQIVEDPKGKGRLFAKHPAFEKPGSVLTPEKYQGDKTTGVSVQLEVAMVSANGKDIQFRPPH